MATFNSSRATEAFARLASALEDAGAPIRRGSMMGRPILKIGSTMFACLSLEKAGFKLGAGAAAHDAALKVRKAGLFDPGGKGRLFKDWVGIPLSAVGTWRKFAELAIARAMEAQGGAGKGKSASGGRGRPNESLARPRAARRGAALKRMSTKAAEPKDSASSPKKRGVRAGRTTGAKATALAPTRGGRKVAGAKRARA